MAPIAAPLHRQAGAKARCRCDALVSLSPLSRWRRCPTGAAPPKLPTPSDIVAASPAAAWAAIPPDDLLVIDLKSGGRVVVQLAPAFAPVHVANIQALARAGYWDGATIYRVQDNYVAQWGNNDSEKPWPAGVVAKPPAEYYAPLKGLQDRPARFADPMRRRAGFADGWPVAYIRKAGTGRTSPIAMAASASAGTCRPIPAPAANFMRSSAMRRASSTATSRSSGGWSSGIERLIEPAARDRGARLLQGPRAGRADRDASGWRRAMDAARIGRRSNICGTDSASFARWLKVKRQPATTNFTSVPRAGSICATLRCRCGAD